MERVVCRTERKPICCLRENAQLISYDTVWPVDDGLVLLVEGLEGINDKPVARSTLAIVFFASVSCWASCLPVRVPQTIYVPLSGAFERQVHDTCGHKSDLLSL